jgi:hypothetical protein
MAKMSKTTNHRIAQCRFPTPILPKGCRHNRTRWFIAHPFGGKFAQRQPAKPPAANRLVSPQHKSANPLTT